MNIERYDRRSERLPRLSHDGMRTIMSRADVERTPHLLAAYGLGRLDLSGGWGPDLVEQVEDAIDHAFATPEESRDLEIARILHGGLQESDHGSTVLTRIGVPVLHVRAAVCMTGTTTTIETRRCRVQAYGVGQDMLQIKLMLDGMTFTTSPAATTLLVTAELPQTMRTAIIGLPIEAVVEHPVFSGLGLVVETVSDFGTDAAIKLISAR